MDEKNIDIKEPLTVPYIVWESDRARSERIAAKLIGVIILLVVCLVGSNAFWVYEWTQYDYLSEDVTTTYEQDGEGLNNINTGTQGDVLNEPKNDSKEKDTEQETQEQ